jgi:hypothetical protein
MANVRQTLILESRQQLIDLQLNYMTYLERMDLHL